MTGRRGFTLIELLVSIAIIATLIALLAPAVQQARESARNAQCRSHLRQLALALHNYHSARRILPAGTYLQGPAFPVRSGWGWGAMILPDVDQGPLYGRIDFNNGTAFGSNGSNVIATSLPVFLCPSDPSPTHLTVTIPGGPTLLVATGNYAGAVEALAAMSAVRFRDITDGLSNTLLVGEREYQRGNASGQGQFTTGWYGSLAYNTGYLPHSLPIEEATTANPINSATDSFSSRHSGGAFFALADGSVRFLSENINRNVYAALGTIAGGESISF